MAHPRRRHYRVAQKAVEAQACHHEDEQRRDSVLLYMLVIILITQLLGLVVKMCELHAGDSESY